MSSNENVETVETDETVETVVNFDLLTLFRELFIFKINEKEDLFKEYSLTIPENIQLSIAVLINNHTSIFSDIQSSLAKIVIDNKIDTKDTPEILAIIGKVYELLYKSKHITKKVDYYAIINYLIYLSTILYLRNKNILNNEIIENMSIIIKSSIELIKLKSSLKTPKFKFF
jgi:hypothetical protein